MDIDALLASQNPDDLRSLALKLLADLEMTGVKCAVFGLCNSIKEIT
ncbi:hypothetical protein SJI19_23550 [Acerihabitans sp. TG2]|nr:hypothetical protein [Acerihabitans sp. TG2]MEA9393470.1 hypothetical protein [Acerihabitans sp. TG2]